MRALEFVADNPGDWAFHCHKSHHVMNAMGHNIPTMIGVDHRGIAQKIMKLDPDYMVMGERGMADMGEMQMPLPGQHAADDERGRSLRPGSLGEMGGMFYGSHSKGRAGTWRITWIRAGTSTRTGSVRLCVDGFCATRAHPAPRTRKDPCPLQSEWRARKPAGHTGHALTVSRREAS
jgi:hypothetical protein